MMDNFSIPASKCPGSSFCTLRGSRRVHFAGITDHPNDFWVSQQARQLIWKLDGRKSLLHFLIHDNDRKFTRRSDTVFASEGYHVIHTPFEAPNANA